METITKRLEQNVKAILAPFGGDISFDILQRRFKVGGKSAVLIFIDGFAKSLDTIEIMKSLMAAPRSGLGFDAAKHIRQTYLPYFEVEEATEISEVLQQMLAGPVILLVDGIAKAFILDVREYPQRSIEEPDLERVTRGSREGFVETGIMNTTMIRRRVRDPNLRFEAHKVGTRSQTDIFIGYIDDIVDPGILAEIKKRVAAIDREALIMGGKSLEECIFGASLNPLPRTRYTERPDVAAAHLYEGHVLILADTSPFAMIAPVTAWHFTQHAEEFFQNPTVGTYLRWIRTFGILLSLLIVPLWYVLATHTALPETLDFIGLAEEGRVPLWLQFLLLEVGVDLIRIALIHTPNALATSLGLVGAILLGELAVDVGLFAPEAILYAAVAAIGAFATPSIEMSHAVRLFRLFILLGTIVGGWYGLAVTLLVSFFVVGRKNILGIPYLWPLVPFDWQALRRILFRSPIPQVRSRPRMTEIGDVRSGE